MRKSQKIEISQTLALLDTAHNAVKKAVETGNQETALVLLEQCQDSAMQIGNLIEDSEGEGFVTIPMLEDYCEQLYQTHELIRRRQTVNAGKIYKSLRKELIRIENSVKNDVPVRTIAVFLPYKASMWDSLESVWMAADADPDCNAYVIPIPYYDKNADGTFGEAHYEGNEFPADVPVTGYEDYDFEENHPDIIFIHNPYDECNHVTSVHPFFYIKNLKNFSDQVVYIPYFILGEGVYESVCVTPGTVFTDRMVAHSEAAMEGYIKYLKKFYLENNDVQGEKAEKAVEKMLWEKILPLGSPKIDKVVNGKREDYELPEEWKKRLDGRKAVLYNTGVSGILHGNEQELKKILDTITFFAGRDDVVLWWRPHPLSGSTMQSMRPQLFEAYLAIVEEYKRSGIGIYDDTADLHRALLWTDMYYGDDSSLIYLYGVQGKPIVRQNIECLMQTIAKGSDRSISHKVSCPVGTDIYFSAQCYNRLYHLDMSNGRVREIGEIPQELQMETSLYSNILYNDGILWLVPSKAHALAAYHLDTGSWEQYELPDRIKSSSVTDGILYMVSSDYRHLWIMDLQEKDLVKKEIAYRKGEKLPLSDEYYNDDFYVIDGKSYYLITHSNLLAVCDLENGQAELLHIGTSGNQYQRLLYDGSCFWFLPNSEKCNVACWDKKTVKESDSNAYPQGFSLFFGFSHAVFREDGLWLFPYKGNMVLRMNRETMETECALHLSEILSVDSIRMDSVLALSDGRLVMTTSATGTDNRVTILDGKGQVLEQYPCVCPDGKAVAAEKMFERLETEKYTSAYAYQTSEEIEYPLFGVCDALVNGADTYREEQNYYRSLYANSDGTAGSHIWEALKAW